MPTINLDDHGAALAIAAMALATYLCRISGVVLMSRVRLTPAVQRALAALPGSIVAATVVPIAARSGIDAIAGIMAGVVAMVLTRNEVVALAAGLGLAAALRFTGLT
jgi:uncharacterized membrane protein